MIPTLKQRYERKMRFKVAEVKLHPEILREAIDEENLEKLVDKLQEIENMLGDEAFEPLGQLKIGVDKAHKSAFKLMQTPVKAWAAEQLGGRFKLVGALQAFQTGLARLMRMLPRLAYIVGKATKKKVVMGKPETPPPGEPGAEPQGQAPQKPGTTGAVMRDVTKGAGAKQAAAGRAPTATPKEPIGGVTEPDTDEFGRAATKATPPAKKPARSATPPGTREFPIKTKTRVGESILHEAEPGEGAGPAAPATEPTRTAPSDPGDIPLEQLLDDDEKQQVHTILSQALEVPGIWGFLGLKTIPYVDVPELISQMMGMTSAQIAKLGQLAKAATEVAGTGKPDPEDAESVQNVMQADTPQEAQAAVQAAMAGAPGRGRARPGTRPMGGRPQPVLMSRSELRQTVRDSLGQAAENAGVGLGDQEKKVSDYMTGAIGKFLTRMSQGRIKLD